MTKLPQIPGYRVIKKLGQGGMADVYLGIQEKLQRNVAIKVMIPLLFRDEQFSRRFIKEAQTAAQLNHPNIITIHDVGETGDSYYIVMEYLEESLSERLKQRGFFPPRQALEVVKMIAGALDYAHKKGFIHRDIKPDNIMFRADGTVVLVDFGIARAMDSTTHLTRTGMSIGTPHYMSPEQCKGEKIDGRSDIYSLGVQFFEIITGKVPYNAENTAGIIIKHIQEPVPRLPDRLSRYQPLIDKMMAKERERRFQTGEELIRFIVGMLSTRESVPPTTWPEPVTTSLEEPTIPSLVPSIAGLPAMTAVEREKKKWLVPAMAAAALVLLAAVLLYFITREPVSDKDKASTLDQPVRETGETGETLGQKQPKEKSPVAGGTQTAAKKDTQDQGKTDTAKKETPPPKEEPKPVEKKITARETIPGKKNDTGLKQVIPQEKTGPLKIEKKEVQPLAVRTVNLLEVSPPLREEYNKLVQQVQIVLRKVGFKAHGQVTLEVSIDERGKVSVLSLQDMLTVNPEGVKSKVIDGIKQRISYITLPPPKDKDGNPVRFNWRITYKVGKYLNRIVLIKQ
jgi:serine/threonine protein kinase